MNFLQAIILSIVEGITEFLPVSSTGHLVLASDLLNIPQTDFVKSFEIIIQLGAIFAVLVLYFKTLINNFKIWQRIIISFIPTSIFGLIFYKIIKDVLLGDTLITLTSLLLGGVALIAFELIYKEKDHHVANLDEITFKQAFLIGVCQSISMVPGVSRAAATILGGMFVGLKRTTATEFSFLLAIPTMAGATVLDLTKANFKFSSSEYLTLTVGLLGSFITAFLVIKFLINYVKKNTFIPFGIYRIILSILFWLMIVRS